ncbi:MAG: GldG family protein [Chloroflexi bacterium]|nr:GldG family protein [Chloroflexota bacterium]
MSQRSDDQPRDWRRRRRGSSPSAAGSGAPEEAPADSEGEFPVETTDETAETITSRTLFSFLEPSLNAVGSFGTPVVIAGVVALFIGIGLIAFVTSMRLYGVILVGVGVVLVGTIGLIFLSAVFAAFISRTGRYGVNTLVMLAAFSGIVVVVNFISFANHTRIDTTATNQFSLHSSTKNLLDDLEEPVRAIAFYREDISGQDPGEFQQLVRRAKVEDTLGELRNRSSKFSYEFKDPEVDPDSARKYGVTQYESIVVIGTESGLTDTIQRTDQVYSQLEQDLYTGILVATGQEQRAVYFLAGHGERSISAGGGYGSLREGLERDNYQVQTLQWNLADEEVNVPDDAALLVIADPTTELPETHAQALNLYLQGLKADGGSRREGGRMIFMAEPDLPESFRMFLTGWGVVVDEGYILDLDGSQPGSPHTLRVERYNPVAPQEIVIPRGSPLDVSLMPGVASLIPIPDDSRLSLPLAGTSANSFLVDDIESTQPLPEDPRGPFVPALYLQAAGLLGSPLPDSAPPESQISGIIVFGDADFVSNTYFNRGSGSALFLNSANFLLGDFSLVSIGDRRSEFIEWNLDRNELKFVRLSSWFFVPGLMGLMAALVWWVRR